MIFPTQMAALATIQAPTYLGTRSHGRRSQGLTSALGWLKSRSGLEPFADM